MLSISWPQWIATRLKKKSFRRPRIERLHISLSLEWLEKRELLTTAVPLVINQPQEKAVALTAPGSTGYTPNQISKAYGFDQITFNNGTVKGDGTGQTIAIVSAYNDPNILNDLNAFSLQFGLPTASLSVLNQTGGYALPEADPTGSWATEDALDVEWAHAMAPRANIVLVEANSDNISDLLAAARAAADMPSVSVVSMSWGNAEFPNEINYDSYFTTPAGHTGVTFVAASGDSGAPPIYPAVSPNVLAVGGTTLTLDSQGNYVSETGWSGSGGGISAYEPQPGYQHNVVSQSSIQRTNPDVAYDADTETGFAVYDSYQDSAGTTSPWIVTAGTSAGAPQWSALIAIANQGRALAGEAALDGPSQTMPLIYQMPGSYFHDILTGSSTGKPSYSAGPGYDLVTGRGSPRANQVVNYLVGSSASPQTGPSSSGSSPKTSPAEPGAGNQVQDGNFASPSVGANQVLNPTGSPWLFLGWSGIAGNGSTLTNGNAPAPGGLQVAFLYNQGSSILQSVSLAAGTYVLSFQGAQVGTIANSREQIQVLVGGIVVAVVTPGPNYTTETAIVTVPSAGNYTLQFEGMAPNDGNAALLDDVTLEGIVPGAGPTSPSSPPPSPSPGSPQAKPPSGSQAPTSPGQSPQGGFDPTTQPLLTSVYDFLLSDLLFVQTAINQILQTTNTTAAIQLVPNLNGVPQQEAIGLLLQSWQWVEQLLSE